MLSCARRRTSSRIFFQITLVISSPSNSTTGLATTIRLSSDAAWQYTVSIPAGSLQYFKDRHAPIVDAGLHKLTCTVLRVDADRMSLEAKQKARVGKTSGLTTTEERRATLRGNILLKARIVISNCCRGCGRDVTRLLETRPAIHALRAHDMMRPGESGESYRRCPLGYRVNENIFRSYPGDPLQPILAHKYSHDNF